MVEVEEGEPAAAKRVGNFSCEGFGREGEVCRGGGGGAGR